MKKLFLTLLVGGALAATTHAQTIKQWDFNTPDGLVATGTVRPLVGSGYPAEATAGLSTQFGAVAGSATTDPDTGNNSQWRIGSVGGTGGFPGATNDNKTAGAQFRVNTSGYENIMVTWDQENSASASRYWRVQYTVNGSDWLDHSTVITALDSGDQTSTPPWQIGLSADFSAIPAANNNADFAFRLVSEFEDTATGAGTNAYVATRTTANYSVNGTLWLDMVTVTGTDLNPGNSWPTVASIADQLTLMGEATAPVPFTVSDVETTAANLTVSASSSNPSLVNNLILGGSDENRTIVAAPEAGQIGTAIITVRAVDEGGKMTESSFELEVVIPTVSRMADQATSWQMPVTNSFTVANLPGDPNTWVFAGTSSDTDIVANEGLEFGDTGSNYFLKITPVANAIGSSDITVTVTSGSWSATTNFTVLLLPEVVMNFSLQDVPLTAPETVAATEAATGLSGLLSRGPGLRLANLTRGFSADLWNGPNSTNNPSSPSRANAISRGDYFEITVTVEAGTTISLATFEAALRRSALNAPMNYELQYSLDGFATPGITIIPQGVIWDNLGWTQSTFTYLGRTSSGTVPANVTPYYYMINDLPLRPNTATSPGDPIPYIDLTGIAELQNVSGPTVVTFRLYAWGNNSTADTNTVALGRVIGPSFRGYVSVAPIAPSLAIELVGGNIRVIWPTSAAGYSLQSTTSVSPASWGPAGGTLTVEGDNNVVTLPATGTQFFRLQQ
jgi:hypothetical protein